MSKQRLIRAVVTRSSNRIFEAEENCIVLCWLPAQKLDGEANHPVALRTTVTEDRWYGVELDSSHKIPVYLGRGESLYAVSKEESHLSMSVIPASAGVILEM